MFASLDPKWHLVRERVRGKADDLKRLLALFPRLPLEYVQLAAELSEYELRHDSGQYFRIWPPITCLEMDAAHAISQRIPGAMAVGDDGGDRVIVYVNGRDGFGVYRVGFGALGIDETRFIAKTINDILTRSAGVLDDDIW